MSLNPLSRPATTALAAFPAQADEVNVYSYRQPELIKPLVDTFTAKTGITVNTVFLQKGLQERLAAEGDGTVALMLNEPDLYRSLDDAARRLEQALREVTLFIEKVKAEGLPVNF